MLKKKRWWDYDIIEPSLNFRMSELQASLGNSQIKKIFKFLKYRRMISKIYDQELSGIKNIKLPQKINCNHSYHLYPILIDFKKINKTKENLFKIFFKKKLNYRYIISPLIYFLILKKKH